MQKLSGFDVPTAFVIIKYYFALPFLCRYRQSGLHELKVKFLNLFNACVSGITGTAGIVKGGL